MSEISVGVIGSGVFGRYHALKCIQHPQVRLTGVYSPDRAQVSTLAKEVEATAFRRADDLIQASDAVIIACAAFAHAEHALAALKADRDILVEKPLTTDIADGKAIITLARNKNRIVQVGHQERFVVRAIGLDRVPDRPYRIEARRMGKFSPRGTDTSVTLDLMTHDLDLVFWLMGQTPNNIQAQAVAVRTKQPDAALAVMDFDHGRARLEASRVEDTYDRQMTLYYPKGRVHIDFNAKTLDHDTPYDLNHDFAQHPDAKDSLAAGLNDFVSAIQNGTSPLVTGEAGLAAVKAAVAVDRTL